MNQVNTTFQMVKVIKIKPTNPVTLKGAQHEGVDKVRELFCILAVVALIQIYAKIPRTADQKKGRFCCRMLF